MTRHALFLFSLVVISAALSWWLADLTPPPTPPTAETERFPDAFATELTVIDFNAQGTLHYKLQAPRMWHYEKRDTTQLERPILWQFDQDGPPWRVQGEWAILTSDTDTLFMPGQVEIHRTGTDQHDPYNITTRALRLNTVTLYAETDQPIRIDSNDYHIDAIGMRGWLRDPVKIKLLDHVRGRYEIQ